MALELTLLKPDTTPSFYESGKTLSNDEHSQFLKKTVTLSLLPRMKQHLSDPCKTCKLRMRLEHGPNIGPMMFWKKQILEQASLGSNSALSLPSHVALDTLSLRLLSCVIGRIGVSTG